MGYVSDLNDWSQDKADLMMGKSPTYSALSKEIGTECDNCQRVDVCSDKLLLTSPPGITSLITSTVVEISKGTSRAAWVHLALTSFLPVRQLQYHISCGKRLISLDRSHMVVFNMHILNPLKAFKDRNRSSNRSVMCVWMCYALSSPSPLNGMKLRRAKLVPVRHLWHR